MIEFKKISLKWKVISIIAPLCIGLTLFSLDLIVKNFKEWREGVEFLRALSYVQKVTHVIHASQIERGRSIQFLNKKISVEELGKSRAEVDKYLNALSVSEDSVELPLQKQLELFKQGLAESRKLTDANGNKVDILKKYALSIENLILFQIKIHNIFPFLSFEDRILSYAIFESAKENMGKLRAQMTAIIGNNQPIDQLMVSQIEGFRTSIHVNLNNPALQIDESTRSEVERVLNSHSWKFVLKSFDTVLLKANSGEFGLDTNEFFKNITQAIDDFFAVMQKETSLVDTAVQSAFINARNDFFFKLILTTLGIIIVNVISYRFVQSLSDSMNSISFKLQNGAKNVANSSRDLSLASSKVSSGVTEQAAAIQETVSSLDQVRAMVEKNAENSSMATKNANQCVSAAQQGQTTVREMVGSIHDIEESTLRVHHQIEKNNEQLSEIVKVINEINGKTKVINDIVFQTKLLSFNASVEAARAGEHGRGFAVVAEEVGNLAHMSGLASRDIAQILESGVVKVEKIVEESRHSASELIKYSTDKVAIGKNSASQCDQVLGRIIESIDSMAKLINDISTASNEQASGVNEISNAMNELSKVTEQNAQSAGQSASSAEKLNRQSHELFDASHELITLVNGLIYKQAGQSSSGPKNVVVPLPVNGAKNSFASTPAKRDTDSEIKKVG